ncbi:hypothetical protein HanIR_Chr05g0243521 [Helianthus annuus]|nr:hypothetical protein HanIR_Chr05g0243521 [Helianthus annuus]
MHVLPVYHHNVSISIREIEGLPLILRLKYLLNFLFPLQQLPLTQNFESDFVEFFLQFAVRLLSLHSYVID